MRERFLFRVTGDRVWPVECVLCRGHDWMNRKAAVYHAKAHQRRGEARFAFDMPSTEPVEARYVVATHAREAPGHGE